MAKLIDVESVGSYFQSLSDPRHTRNRKHLLGDIIVIAVCGILCNCDGPTAIHRWAVNRADWLHEILNLPNGIPSRDCIRRLLLALKPQAFQECFQNWIAKAITTDDTKPDRLVAIDGKTCRGSHDAGKGLWHALPIEKCQSALLFAPCRLCGPKDIMPVMLMIRGLVPYCVGTIQGRSRNGDRQACHERSRLPANWSYRIPRPGNDHPGYRSEDSHPGGDLAGDRAYTWSQAVSGATSLAYGLLIAGSIGGFIVALVTIFNPKISPFTAPIYAALEGLVLGAISAVFETIYPGIVIQAVG